MSVPACERVVGEHHAADAEHERGGELGEHLDEREVHGHELLRPEARVQVAAGHGLELVLVRSLAHVRLGHAHPGQAFLQVGVHRRDLLAGVVVRAARVPLEPHGGTDERRQHQ